MNISQSINYIFPTLEFGVDFIVEDNGNGQELKWYNTTILQPTQAELEAAWLEVEKLQQEEQIKLEKKQAIDALATLSDQLNLMATCIYEITNDTTNPKILEARAKFEAIQTILNK